MGNAHDHRSKASPGRAWCRALGTFDIGELIIGVRARLVQGEVTGAFDPRRRGTLDAPMRRLAIAVAALLGGSAACGFDSTGVGSASGPIVGDPNATAASTGEPMTGSDDSASGAVDGDSGGIGPLGTSGGSDDGDADSESTGPAVDPCAGPPSVIIEMGVEEATISNPMLTGSVGGQSYAYSEATMEGTASFEFDVPCQDEYRVFARVYDPNIGIAVGSDPDSYMVAFDDDGPLPWRYGCQTLFSTVAIFLWDWLPIETHDQLCGSTEFGKTLSAGTHTLHVINRENGNHDVGVLPGDIGNVAAISRVVITSDPGYSPP